MSIVLRIEMLILAIVFVMIVFRAVNKRKLWLQYSFGWILLSLGLLIVAFCPGILDYVADIMQIEVTSNLVYLIAVFILGIISFYLTIIVSKQSEQIKTLIQMCSIEKYINEQKGQCDEEN